MSSKFHKPHRSGKKLTEPSYGVRFNQCALFLCLSHCSLINVNILKIIFASMVTGALGD